MKNDHEQMAEIKSELGTVRNNLKKAEINVEKLNETLKDLKVTLYIRVYIMYWSISVRFFF